MSLLSANYTDSSILIYDVEGNHLINTIITEYDKIDMMIRVQTLPDKLQNNDDCTLLILTSPTPCEFQGKVKKIGGAFYIALFQGRVRENRATTRFNVNAAAKIDSFMSEGKHYELYEQITVNLINISTNGIRFRAPFYTFNDGDIFRINLDIGANTKTLMAEVAYHIDNEPAHSDYGCNFLSM